MGAYGVYQCEHCGGLVDDDADHKCSRRDLIEEVERLRSIIEDAPHDITCPVRAAERRNMVMGGRWEKCEPCNCWKAALREGPLSDADLSNTTTVIR